MKIEVDYSNYRGEILDKWMFEYLENIIEALPIPCNILKIVGTHQGQDSNDILIAIDDDPFILMIFDKGVEEITEDGCDVKRIEYTMYRFSDLVMGIEEYVARGVDYITFIKKN